MPGVNNRRSEVVKNALAWENRVLVSGSVHGCVEEEASMSGMGVLQTDVSWPKALALALGLSADLPKAQKENPDC